MTPIWRPITCRSCSIWRGSDSDSGLACNSDFGQSVHIAKTSSITKWNVLALLAALVGIAVTLTLAEVWLRNWMRSGVNYPIGQRVSAQLPAGKLLVYYESPVAVPVDGDSSATLKVFDADKDPIPVRALRRYGSTGSSESMDYRLWLTGWSGRALWEIDVPAAGTYTLVCHNHSVLSDKDIPADDRAVLLRQPPSFAQVRTVRVFILVTGATITMTAVIALYTLHMLALRKRRRLAAEGQSPVGMPT